MSGAARNAHHAVSRHTRDSDCNSNIVAVGWITLIIPLIKLVLSLDWLETTDVHVGLT